MPQTFAYDLVSFLRVLYRRRGMIFVGTIGMTVLVAIASLVWPQTWRADARILVSTPKYKASLRLVPEPYDVLAYQGVLESDPLYTQVLDTLRWFHRATRSLQEGAEYLKRVDAFLGAKAQGMTLFVKIQNSSREILEEFLVPADQKKNPVWVNRLEMFDNLNAEELRIIADMEEDQLNELSVFDLRKLLSSRVDKVRETNMEVEYSQAIQVSAKFNTAAGSKLVANTLLDLFLIQAETLVKDTVEQQVQFTQKRVEGLETDLSTAEKELAEYEKKANLSQLQAELATKIVQLTGMNPNRRIADQAIESFDLENANEPFMKELREKSDSVFFLISDQYEQALLPRRLQVERDLLVFDSLTKTQGGSLTEEQLQQKNKFQAELVSLKDQSKDVSREIVSLWETIRQHEMQIDQLRRNAEKVQSTLTALRPLLDEAAILTNHDENFRYSDVSIERAIRPDKRTFPKRSMMTATGMVLSFFLWCCMAFFLDIWQEVIKPESPIRNEENPNLTV